MKYYRVPLQVDVCVEAETPEQAFEQIKNWRKFWSQEFQAKGIVEGVYKYVVYYGRPGTKRREDLFRQITEVRRDEGWSRGPEVARAPEAND